MFQKSFSFFYPFFKPLQISFKFTCTPALSCVSVTHIYNGGSVKLAGSLFRQFKPFSAMDTALHLLAALFWQFKPFSAMCEAKHVRS